MSHESLYLAQEIRTLERNIDRTVIEIQMHERHLQATTGSSRSWDKMSIMQQLNYLNSYLRQLNADYDVCCMKLRNLNTNNKN